MSFSIFSIHYLFGISTQIESAAFLKRASHAVSRRRVLHCCPYHRPIHISVGGWEEQKAAAPQVGHKSISLGKIF